MISIVGAALLLPSALHAQSYSINWYTVAGGGGTSSGAIGGVAYSVSGTIGQPATATMSGANYSLTGGFWSFLAAVQTAGSPFLTITRSNTLAIISWSSSATGFVLQQSSTLQPNSWSTSTNSTATNASTISVTVPATNGYQYFRLVNP